MLKTETECDVSDEDGVATSDPVEGEDEEDADRRIGDRGKNKVQNRISGQLKKFHIRQQFFFYDFSC
jgi:hypothetical protein